MKKGRDFLIVDSTILPCVFKKVILAKEFIRTRQAKGVTDAVEKAEISRSTFYKYKDSVFNLSEDMGGNKASLFLLLAHEPGVLAKILHIMATEQANILTIVQDIPINKVANLTLTIEMSKIKSDLEEVLRQLNQIEGVLRAEIITVE